MELLRAPVRQAGALSDTKHRPWPPPQRSWLMGQTWESLLFAHWRVDAEALRGLVPAGLTVDEHDGSAWLGITPFELTSFRLRGTFPLPLVSHFPEINVRTYVTAEDKPGIWFFSLDTPSLFAVEAARRAYKLPYFLARISVQRDPDGRVAYSATRRRSPRPFAFDAAYAPAGVSSEPEAGSLECFLTERYCLYAFGEGGLHRAEIHHAPWRICPAEARIGLNTMAPDDVELQGEALLHLGERQDVIIWSLERIPRK